MLMCGNHINGAVSCIGSPALIVESLIITQQFAIAKDVLTAQPRLQDDAMLLRYAR